MYHSRRRPRHWLLSSKFLVMAVGALVIASSSMDGIEYEEMLSNIIVLGIALFVVYRSDQYHAQIDDLERRLTTLGAGPERTSP